MKANYNKKSEREDYLNSPCTITEAVQIARGVAEDVLSGYAQRNAHVTTAISLQMEVLKSFLIESGLITEDKFKELYLAKIEEFNKLQEEFKNNEESQTADSDVKMDVAAGDLEVEVTKREE